ncbi:TrgA family protein [Aestuariibius sp. HNIBRBA575]|uniref:TrgA family protein n=1 Tax=Aestuariibius sp. HNIBRBA575 TaxID=3233343 RepID=UPI0034A2E796
MPTFARLMAAILFAALAAYVSELTKPLYPPERQLNFYTEFNAFCGLIVGWRVAGSRAGIGISGAIGYGLTAAVAVFITALFFQCAYEMVMRSLQKQYDTAPEAVIGVFELMYEYGIFLSTVQVWAVTLVGGILAGILTELVSRRFD